MDADVKKKNHHYIARTYLERFTNADGRVSVYRKDDPLKPIQQAPEEVAKHKHYYRQPKPDGTFDHNSLEDVFDQEVESKWPAIVDGLENRADINPSLMELFAFIALHRVRVPASRDAAEQVLSEMVKMEGRRLERNGALPPWPEKLSHLGDVWNHIDVAIDPHQSIHAMRDALEATANILDRVGIVAVHNATTVPFVTSDNPVIWYDPSVAASEMRPYAIRDDGPVELLFPASPGVMIYGHSSIHARFGREGCLHVEVADEAEVERINTLVCRFAYEAVFASEATFSELVQEHAAHSPIVKVDTVPTPDGEFIYLEQAWGPRPRKPKWKAGLRD